MQRSVGGDVLARTTPPTTGGDVPETEDGPDLESGANAAWGFDPPHPHLLGRSPSGKAVSLHGAIRGFDSRPALSLTFGVPCPIMTYSHVLEREKLCEFA